MEIKFNTKITVDSALSTTSENPVQNKVVTQAINKNKVTVDSALSTTSVNPVQNKVIDAALANITPSESKSFTFWVNASNSGNQTITTDKPVFITYFENGNLKGISSTGSAEITADASSFVTIYHNNDISSLSLSGFSIDTFDATILPSTVTSISIADSQCREFLANKTLEDYTLSSIGLENFSFDTGDIQVINELSLNNNSLTSFYIPGDIIGISKLYLNNNQIKEITTETNNIPVTDDFRINNNSLTSFSLSLGQFVGMLDLSYNSLESFDFSVVGLGIVDLSLMNNNISQLDGSIIPTNLFNIFLDNNPFASDEKEAENFANSLPDISIGSQNISFSSTDTQFSLIQIIAVKKGWHVYQN